MNPERTLYELIKAEIKEVYENAGYSPEAIDEAVTRLATIVAQHNNKQVESAYNKGYLRGRQARNGYLA